MNFTLNGFLKTSGIAHDTLQTMDNRTMKILICLLMWLITLNCFIPPLTARTLATAVAKEDRDSLDIEILTAIAQKLKAKLILQEAPFNRRLYLMRDGTINLMAGLLKHPEREEYIRFVQPPYKNRSDTVFFVPKGSASLIQTYEDLYPLKIGTILGSKYFHQFDEDKRLNKDPAPKGITNFKKLLLGRLDTVIAPEGAGIDRIQEMGIADKIEMAPYRFSKEKQVYIGISKKSSLMENIDEIESVIRQMIEAGEIKKIIIDYYTQRNLPVPAH
jgi:polar amino acid transport system substrate-binding protein